MRNTLPATFHNNKKKEMKNFHILAAPSPRIVCVFFLLHLLCLIFMFVVRYFLCERRKNKLTFLVISLIICEISRMPFTYNCDIRSFLVTLFSERRAVIVVRMCVHTRDNKILTGQLNEHVSCLKRLSGRKRCGL
jgi:hypothetical protein